MTVFRHELRQGKASFLIWTCSVGFLLAVCVFLFPEMKGQMEEIGSAFASMGAFTEAFGMDQLNFGTLTGFYAIECGNVLGLGGAFYACICAAGMLAKEENNKTAEFLLTHPVSRVRIVTEKLLAVLFQITAMNLIIYALSVLSMTIISEAVPWREVTLMHAAYFLLQTELAGVCLGISAFLRRGSVAVGLGVTLFLYFLNLIGNISDASTFLKYLTPFGYCDGAELVSTLRMDAGKTAAGLAAGLAGVITACLAYARKDIR